jgi:hypothetical protein
MDPIYNKIMALALQKQMKESKLSVEGQKENLRQLTRNIRGTS